ncbi:MAG: phenylacetic acid degradation protein PaaY [Actinomycetota bacterium]|nr:phenylacetic acid degradation protein PaaY [Actinomycetota bacterium]
MPIYSFEGRSPRISPSAYVDPSAVIIGDVYIGDNCYIGPGAVIRGDWGRVVIEEGSNLQDNAVIHARPTDTTYLGPDSHVGHGAILHGCRLEGHVLVGMGAVINDGAFLEEASIVASGALVPPGMRVAGRTVVAGVPAEVLGEVDESRDTLLWIGTRAYQSLPDRYRSECSETSLEDARERYREEPSPG